MQKESSFEHSLMTEFQRQWSLTVSHSPLVAAALLLKDDRVSQSLSSQQISSLSALTGHLGNQGLLDTAFGKSDTMIAVGVRLSHAFSELERGLARAQNYSDGVAAFETFGDRLQGKGEANPRKCPVCDGTCLIGNTTCYHCGGTGTVW